MAPKYILNYFDLGGRAEGARIMFHLAGVEFTDNRYTPEQWAALKPDTSRFPLNQMPTLEVNETVICQSMAILRYLANEFDLYGSNNDEKAVTDQMVDTMNDLFNAAAKIKFNKELDDDKKKTAFVELFEKEKKSLTFATKLVGKTSGQFCFGSKATLPDLIIYGGVQFISTVYPSVLEEFAELVAVSEEFAKVENVKKYLDSKK